MQLPRSRSDVQAVFMDCYQIAQLLEFHRPAGLIVDWVSAGIGYKFKGARAQVASPAAITKTHVLMRSSSFR
jgi:hypothetical protein